MRHRIAILLPALGLALSVGATVSAQVSPGPLSRAHAELEGAKQCFGCHGAGRGSDAMNPQCLDCHGEIAQRVEGGLGLHGREKLVDCTSCHPEHGGREFEPIDWGRGGLAAFEHGRTGWPLAGKHARLDCRGCHNAKLLRLPVAGAPKRERPHDTWLGLERRCGGCHADYHRDTLGDDCEQCHTSVAWKPASRFDHAATAYPLLGRHTEVNCLDCHLVPWQVELIAPDGRAAARYRPVAHAECSDCHADQHQGRLGPGCAACHVVSGFDRVDDARFDHARTRYPLRGAHAKVRCASCHVPGDDDSRRPAFDRCASCHADPHRDGATLAGRQVDCAACHDERAFRPSIYGVDDHRAAAYPLEGKHAAVRCSACHPATPATGNSAPGQRDTVLLRPAYATCRDCHADDHAGQLADRSGGGACESCHRVEGWVPSTYTAERHAELALPLEGKHREAECAACHAALRAGLAPFAEPTRLGKAGVALVHVESECAECHYDPHETPETFDAGIDCRDCHDADGFLPSTVDVRAHDRFDYPLEGAHRATPCQLCHAELKSPPASIRLRDVVGTARALRFDAAHESCEDCHTDPHGGQFAHRADGGRCAACHDVEGFAPTVGFDHDRDAEFALAGAHHDVACVRCHPGNGGSGDSVVRYRPLAHRCRDCHGNDPRNTRSGRGEMP